MTNSFQLSSKFKLSVVGLTIFTGVLVAVATTMLVFFELIIVYAVLIGTFILALGLLVCISGCCFLKLLRNAVRFGTDESAVDTEKYQNYVRRVAICSIAIVTGFIVILGLFPCYALFRGTPIGYLLVQTGFRIAEMISLISVMVLVFRKPPPAPKTSSKSTNSAEFISQPEEKRLATLP